MGWIVGKDLAWGSHGLFKDTIFVFMSRDFTSVCRDIKAVRESRHYFEKISVDLDSALSRNSQVPRSRPAEAEEAQNLLCATRSCFRHTALDHVHCLSVLQAKKKPEVLGTVSSPSEPQITWVLPCLSGWRGDVDCLCSSSVLCTSCVSDHTLIKFRLVSLLLQLLSFMHACSTFFHQGSDLCQDLDPFLKKLAENVSLLSLI